MGSVIQAFSTLKKINSVEGAHSFISESSMEGVIVTQLARSFIHEGSKGGGEVKIMGLYSLVCIGDELLIVSHCLLCQHLKELQNFNGLMAVAGGLTSSPLSRLHQTQDLLSHDCKKVHILKSYKLDIIAFRLLCYLLGSQIME